MAYKQQTPNSFIQKQEIVDEVESMITSEIFPTRSVLRLLSLLGIGYSALLVMVFSMIVIVRLAYGV